MKKVGSVIQFQYTQDSICSEFKSNGSYYLIHTLLVTVQNHAIDLSTHSALTSARTYSMIHQALFTQVN